MCKGSFLSSSSLAFFPGDIYSDSGEKEFSVVLIYISLIAKDAEYFFMCLVATCISCFEKSSFHFPIYYWITAVCLIF